MDLTIADILECTKGDLIVGNKDEKCESFSKDTRTINKGDTYIGIKGENFNGSLFWKEALQKGANTVIIEKIDIQSNEIEKYKKNRKNIIEVANTKIALEQIATKKRELYGDKLFVIGVTGSVGKTSTKDIIANVLSQKYKTLKTEGNNNNDIGLPLTLLKLKDHEVAVIEMGMNHFGEISKLTKIAKPDLAVITNIGTSHIGNLGSRENILKAKLEILEGMKNKKIVINNDNDLLNEWNNRIKENEDIEVHTFGIKSKSECMAEKIEYKENESNFICHLNHEEFEISVPVQGEHFILNSLCAILVGNLCKIENNKIKNGISSFSLTKKRMEIIKLKNGITIINDSYNASYESMKASINYLENLDAKRKIAVLGDMFELGDFSEELHRKVGQEIKKDKIDYLFLIGENSKYIAQEAMKKGFKKDKIFNFEGNYNLLKKLSEFILEEDVILFKASNGMKLFQIVDELKNNYEKNK